MNEPKNPDHAMVSPAAGPGDTPKKPYVKPAFRHEQIFETMALACGKLQGTQGQCRGNRKNS